MIRLIQPIKGFIFPATQQSMPTFNVSDKHRLQNEATDNISISATEKFLFQNKEGEEENMFLRLRM